MTVPASATSKVVDAVVQGVRTGAFVPGQHLLENDLTKRFGVSRSSLREALKHLAGAGLVTLSQFRGAHISMLDRKSVLDLLDTLEPLARLATRLAAEHCTTDEVGDPLRAIVASLEAAGRVGNRSAYLEERRRFYDTIVAIGGNQELARVMPLSRTDLFRAQVESIQTETPRLRHVTGYAKIAEAILAQDVTNADRAVKRHFDGTRRTIGELPPNAFPSRR